jgi:deoxyribonuclease IV
MLLGAHESIAGGLYKVFARAEADGCEAVQIFTKNASRWAAKPLTEKEIELFSATRKKSNVGPIIAHDSYLINLSAPDEEKLQKSREGFIDELKRAQALDLSFLVTHPGSHLGEGEDKGIAVMVQSLNEILDRIELKTLRIALETTAGQGTNLGYRFEHLRDILAGVKDPDRFVICLDTQHTLAAGYDHRSTEGYAQVFEEFDSIIGLEKLQVFHLNDSKKECGTRVDRHDNIGEGFIGLTLFELLVNDERFAEVPGILETPPLEDKQSSFSHNLKILKGMRR